MTGKDMENVVVERSFDEPVDYEDIQAIEEKATFCLNLHNVQFLHSYFSSDRKRMICVYNAPDAEAVRLAARASNIPFDTIWTASVHDRA